MIVISVWKAKVKAEFPGYIWPYSESDVRQHLFGDSTSEILDSASVNRLAKYYYFSKNIPRDPIVVSQQGHLHTHIHPGICRYIGSALRDEKISLDAIVYVEGNQRTYNPAITWIEQLESVKGKTAYNTAWKKHWNNLEYENYPEYCETLLCDSQQARIELISEFDEKIIFNPDGEWLISENIKNHNGIIPTLKEIFKKVNQAKKSNK